MVSASLSDFFTLHVLINAPPFCTTSLYPWIYYDFVLIFSHFSSVCDIDVSYSKDIVFV